MLFSIIVPVYNADVYLERCVKSILKQEFKDFELILVNDGSKDNSLSLIEKFAKQDNRIKYISQENRGLSYARNRGISMSTGMYIVFVDADDWIDIKFLEISKQYIEKYNPDIITYRHCGSKLVSKEEKKKKFLIKEKQGADKLFDLSISNYAWSKVFRRDIILSYGDEVFPVGRRYEDIATMYKIFCEANIVLCSNEILYFYEQNNVNSITSCRMEKDIKDDIQTLNEMMKFKEAAQYKYWNYYLLVKIFGYMSDLYKVENIDKAKRKKYVGIMYSESKKIKYRKRYLKLSADALRAILVKCKIAHIYFEIKKIKNWRC